MYGADYQGVCMSLQFNFFCNIAEMDQLIPVVQKYDAMIIGAHRFSEQPTILSGFASEPRLKGAYIVLRSSLSAIAWVRLDDSQYYVDGSVSPVIEVSVHPAINGQLRRARLYARKGYDGRDGWVPFPGEMLKLYRSLVSTLKRSLLTQEVRFGARCSPAALKFEANGGEIAQF
jgi:hypothetical protein